MIIYLIWFKILKKANVSVFIDPSAEDYRKIYQYNYAATKLAIKRALKGYPDIDKVLYQHDKDSGRKLNKCDGFDIVKYDIKMHKALEIIKG